MADCEKHEMLHQLDLFQAVEEAKIEAARVGLSANMLIINARLAYSSLSLRYYLERREVPVICGLKAAIDTDHVLPEEVNFIMVHADNPPLTKDEQISILKAENEKLRGIIEQIRKEVKE